MIEGMISVIDMNFAWMLEAALRADGLPLEYWKSCGFMECEALTVRRLVEIALFCK